MSTRPATDVQDSSLRQFDGVPFHGRPLLVVAKVEAGLRAGVNEAVIPLDDFHGRRPGIKLCQHFARKRLG